MKHKIIVWTFLVFIFGFGIWNLISSDQDSSDAERRKLQQFPKLTMENVSSGRFMSDFEKYTQDQFVERDTFRAIKAASELYGFQKMDNNGIYTAEGYACALEYPLDETAITYAIDKFRFVYENYLVDSGSSVYGAVIPDKNYFLAEEHGYLAMDYARMFELIQTNAEFMEYIDITNNLRLEDYYRTDTHWRQECLVDVAEHLADGMQVNSDTFGPIEYNKVTALEEFYGVYTGQLALPLQPDELVYLDSPLLQQCVVFDYQNNREGTVYDLELLHGKDPYEVYLSGDISLLTIENPGGQTGKELILFRDSFGSSIAPLLMAYYDKITLVDIRYLPSSQLDKYIDFDGQDVLFLYSALVLNQSETLK